MGVRASVALRGAARRPVRSGLSRFKETICSNFVGSMWARPVTWAVHRRGDLFVQHSGRQRRVCGESPHACHTDVTIFGVGTYEDYSASTIARSAPRVQIPQKGANSG